ncbi:ATP-binding cassette domain-containing protein [Pelomonas sp. P7]|uniref:ATP-binding cassette domain-containing protein n=1 Tax=Pelomonas caseinilytica TaxID=2906763 RepID=A0ABS8XIC7_9BURK|nr:ATP-binding cassette domain-containing protein [Pelomonas sp. P7]MCE4540609.1 ATP-binding cassette domain-containing protein [Pelomonas sp. P7]
MALERSRRRGGIRSLLAPAQLHPDRKPGRRLVLSGRATQFDELHLKEALADCGLGRLSESLDAVDQWQQKLSGGEQQRLACARVLLHQPEFVFLDEATSAVDPTTEQALDETLIRWTPHKGVISIAHRESLATYHDHTLQVPSGTGLLPLDGLR